MLAWQHLTTTNQRIKLAKRVLSLILQSFLTVVVDSLIE